MRVDPARAVIKVDGLRIASAPDHVYIVLNKPKGVVSTMSDPEGRPSLQDYVADRNARLFHVGRLDTDTEGLILLTNDGDLAHRLAHPSFGVEKTYLAEVTGPIAATSASGSSRASSSRTGWCRSTRSGWSASPATG